TVSNLKPGQTTNFRVSAYDAKGNVLVSKDFQFASAAIQAPEIYEAGQSFEVAVAADASLLYDLSWYYVTETGDKEITDAKGLTSFTPDAATYPIKIVATPISESEGVCVAAPVEAIVNPYVAPQFGINDPYVTTKQSFVTTWDLVPDATRYAVQKMNANGQWVKMTAFNFVDGQIVGDTRATLSEDGTQFSYSVNMVKIGVEERYRVLAIDAKGAILESGEFTYNPVGLTIENDAYDFVFDPADEDQTQDPDDEVQTQTLRAVTVQDVDRNALQYQWYYSTNDDPTNWQVVDGATSADLVLSADEAAQNYNYKVIATDPNEDRQSVAYARADALDAPTNLTRTVDPDTGNLLLTWSADASLSADNFIVQYYRTDGEYSAWSDLPQGTITANGDGTFSLSHVNGVKYEHLRVRAVNETGWSSWYTAIPEDIIVTTKEDVVDPNDGVTSLREAIDAYQTLTAQGLIPPGLAVTFDSKVFGRAASKITLKASTPIIEITENVKIDASNLGYRLQIESEKLKHAVFHVVGENASLELESLFLRRAQSNEDGGILRAEDGATVKVVDCTFKENRTSQHGSAIALFSGSKLIVEDSLFEKNNAKLNGGVIYAVEGSSVTISNSTFKDNKAEGKGQNGGAIYAVDGSSVTISNSTFNNNQAGGNGKAIWIDASSTLDVENSTFTPDGASNLSGSVTTSLGKAIWVDDSVVSSAILDDAFVELEEEIESFF
ncbi:MAG: right-handed parallel beta-helix repeat-containing protein, partial [Thermoguttaceae bacterium]